MTAKNPTTLHVAITGNDEAQGSADAPLRTIQRAADLAQPGDRVVVHAGIYREWVNPPQGGTSEAQRITFEAAPGERVEVRGSEPVTDWIPESGDVWRTEISNAQFASGFNPFATKLDGGWFIPRERPHHRGGVTFDGVFLFEAASLEELQSPPLSDRAKYPERSRSMWFAEVRDDVTLLRCNFGGRSPLDAETEILVRPACFYPTLTGRDFITVRGFHFSRTASPWCSPVAEQVATVGTHWSRGWIIEDNEVSLSRCAGITLGMEATAAAGVLDHERSAFGLDGAVAYVEVVINALEGGWSRDTIGSHIVRRNTVHDCGEAGICGSMGACFSDVSDNLVYDTFTERQFDGHEQAGIKFHGAIDTRIAHNEVRGGKYGIWLDWMTQGTRVTGNLLHDNYEADLYIEVSHGPYVVDGNTMLSEVALLDRSQGGLYVDNVFAGGIKPEAAARVTPYLRPHSTALAGFRAIRSGDNHFFNNIFIKNTPRESITAEKGYGYGLAAYAAPERYATVARGNSYLGGAEPMPEETPAHRDDSFDGNIVWQVTPAQVRNLPVIREAGQGNRVSPAEKNRIGITAVGRLPFPDIAGSASGSAIVAA